MGWDGMGRDGSPYPAPPLAPRSILWKLLGMSKYSYVSQSCGVWDPRRPSQSPGRGDGGWDHPVLHPQSVFVDFLCGLGICIFNCVDVAELLHFWE